MIVSDCNSLSEKHRLVLLEVFDDCEEFLISCGIFLLGLGKFLGLIRDQSSPLADDCTHLVVSRVGVDIEFLFEIGIVKHRIFGDYFFYGFKSRDCFVGPDDWTVLLLSSCERHDWG